jgi:hypothetical protein
MMRFIQLLLFFVIFSAFTYSSDVKLEYTFKVGDQYEWTHSSKQAVKQSIPGMGEMAIDITMDETMQWKVIELSTGGAKIEAHFDKLRVLTKSPMGEVNVDSEGKADDTQTKVAKSLIGKKFSFTMTKRGSIENVEGTENLYSGLNTLGLDEATLAAVKQSLEQTINPKMLEDNLETGFINYPENKIKPGDTWKSTTSRIMQFALQINNTWNFQKVEGSTATFNADGEIVSVDKEKISTLPNGMKTKADLGGRQAVVGKVNVKTGWPSEFKTLSEIKGKMVLLAGGMIPQDMDVPIEINTEATYTIVKK